MIGIDLRILFGNTIDGGDVAKGTHGGMTLEAFKRFAPRVRANVAIIP
jgi:hypothetical protein